MEKLYKYRGGISEMSAFGNTAREIVLYDLGNDDKAPTRLSVYGGLAKYIYEIEMTDAEERYLKSDYFFDRTLHLCRIEVPSHNPLIPAKIITQSGPLSDEAVIFGPREYIECSDPEPMSIEELTAWHSWRTEH